MARTKGLNVLSDTGSSLTRQAILTAVKEGGLAETNVNQQFSSDLAGQKNKQRAFTFRRTALPSHLRKRLDSALGYVPDVEKTRLATTRGTKRRRAETKKRVVTTKGVATKQRATTEEGGNKKESSNEEDGGNKKENSDKEEGSGEKESSDKEESTHEEESNEEGGDKKESSDEEESTHKEDSDEEGSDKKESSDEEESTDEEKSDKED
ncbi:protein bfr2-like [Orbicella faveolata]|uniref:protein bfr2-like n=1 Tax=Orbicella faveolata TaxID=48498 RepID=UPI0009E4C50D|nr:protein bfr2-like [Orbicella faveolata]